MATYFARFARASLALPVTLSLGMATNGCGFLRAGQGSLSSNSGKPSAATAPVPSATQATQANVIALGTDMSQELATNLVAAGLTQPQAQTVASSSVAEVSVAAGNIAVSTLALADRQPIQYAAGPVVKGAIEILSDPRVGLADLTRRTAIAKVIMASTFTSLDGRVGGIVKNDLLALHKTMVGTAVTNLDAGGLGGDHAPAALGAVTSGAVGALTHSVGAADVAAAAAQVVAGAVGNLGTLKLSSTLLLSATSSAASGTVGTLTAAGIDQSQISAAAQQVAAAAVGALSDTGVATAGLGAAAGAVAAGAIQGLGTAGLTPEQIVSSNSISAIVTGASGALNLSALGAGNTTSVLGQIAGSAITAIATSSLSGAADSVKQAVLSQVISGSAAGIAQVGLTSSAGLSALSKVTASTVEALPAAGFSAAASAAAAGVAVAASLNATVTSGLATASQVATLVTNLGAAVGAACASANISVDAGVLLAQVNTVAKNLGVQNASTVLANAMSGTANGAALAGNAAGNAVLSSLQSAINSGEAYASLPSSVASSISTAVQTSVSSATTLSSTVSSGGLASCQTAYPDGLSDATFMAAVAAAATPIFCKESAGVCPINRDNSSFTATWSVVGDTSTCTLAVQSVTGTATASPTPAPAPAPAPASGTPLGIQVVGASLTLDPGYVAELSPAWTPQWSSVIGYWSLDGALGYISDGSVVPAVVGAPGTAADPSGTGISYVPGKLKQGIQLTGTDGSMTVHSASTTNAASFSAMAWFQTTASSDQKILCTDNGNCLLATYGSVVRVCIQPYCYTGQAPVNDGAWHLAVVVGDGKAMRTYVDGNPTPDFTMPGSSSAFSTNYYIGFDGGGSYFFNGNIDEIAVFNQVLAPADIALIYERQAPAHSGTLVSKPLPLSAGNVWSSLGWVTSLPYGKPLPDGGQSETAYAAETANLMTSINALWHLSGPPGQVGDGTAMSDGSGSGYNGTLTNSDSVSASFGPGPFGEAITFSSPNAYIALGTTAGNFNMSDFTVSVWAKTTGTGTMHMLQKRNVCGNESYWHFRISGGQPQFEVVQDDSGANDTEVDATLDVNDGAWHHLVAERIGATLYLYIDGVPNAQRTGPGTANINNGDVLYAGTIPCAGSTQSYVGALSEIALWNRALSPAEVFQVYRRGANRLKFQVRGCSVADCSDSPPWLGPDGTNLTYFSEALNNSAAGMPWGPAGTVLPSLPLLSLAPYALGGLTSAPYLQYQALMESDDVGTACGGAWCSPDLSNVVLGAQPPGKQ